MSALGSQLVGRDRRILLVRLPSMVTDERVGDIREEVRQGLARLASGDDRAGVVLDFAAVELINSIGITCLLQVEEDCRKARRPLLLASVPAAIGQFLSQLKLNRRFPTRASVDEAVAALDAAG